MAGTADNDHVFGVCDGSSSSPGQRFVNVGWYSPTAVRWISGGDDTAGLAAGDSIHEFGSDLRSLPVFLGSFLRHLFERCSALEPARRFEGRIPFQG